MIQHDRWANLGLYFALLAAVLMRISVLIHQPVFAHDEASIGVDLLHRGLLGFLRPLDFNQTAPPLFLMATKLLVSTLGTGEWVFRLIPMVSSLAAVTLLARLAKLLLGAQGATFTIWLAAFSPLVLLYSNIFKQYASDTLATVALLSLAMAVLQNPLPWRGWLNLCLAGCLILLFSQPAIFIVGGVLVALTIDEKNRDAKMFARCVLIAMIWFALFGLLYWTLYRPVASSPYMQHFWSNVIGGSLGHRVIEAVWNLFGPDVLPFHLPALIGLCVAVIGIGAMWVNRGAATTLLLVVPYMLLLVASALGKFPVYERLVLFITPITFLLAGAAIDFVIAHMSRGWRLATTLVVLLSCIVATVISWPIYPTWSDHARELLNREVKMRGHSEPVFILPRSIPSWAFYTDNWSHNPARYEWFARTYQLGNISFGDMPSRNGRAFEADPSGQSLGAGRKEYLGLYSGLQNKMPMPEKEITDAGWAEHERRRMEAIAQPCVWLYSMHSRLAEHLAMRRALQRSGAKIPFSDTLTHDPDSLPNLQRVCWSR